MSISAAIFLTAWARVVRRAGAKWTRIPMLNRIPLPAWVQGKVDAAIDDTLDTVEDGK